MSTLLLILKMTPLLLATVQEIEATAQVPKAGAAKLQLLTGVVKTALQLEPVQSLIPFDKLLPVIETITGQVVSFYNLLGVFKKSA